MGHKKNNLDSHHRILLHTVAKDIMETCNKIYTDIDRNPNNFDDDVKPLIRVFNKLVHENQVILQHLYPDRPKVVVTHLALKTTPAEYTLVTDKYDTNKVVDETEIPNEEKNT